jgi:hypothetical protein
MTALETAAVIRRSPGALEQWRRDPNLPLKWRYVDGRPLVFYLGQQQQAIAPCAVYESVEF